MGIAENKNQLCEVTLGVRLGLLLCAVDNQHRGMTNRNTLEKNVISFT